MFIKSSLRVIVRVRGHGIEDSEWDTGRALNTDLVTMTVIDGRVYRVVAYRFRDLTGENPQLDLEVVPTRFGPQDVSVDAESDRDVLRNLLLEVANAGRELTDEEIRTIREQVAQAGYDPAGHTPAGGRLAGLSVQGQILTGKSRVRVGDAHYLRHVVG